MVDLERGDLVQISLLLGVGVVDEESSLYEEYLLFLKEDEIFVVLVGSCNTKIIAGGRDDGLCLSSLFILDSELVLLGGFEAW